LAQDSDLERTEQASPRRLEEARRKGQVAHSRELVTFLMLMAVGGAGMMMASHLMQVASHLMQQGLRVPREMAFNPALMFDRLGQLAKDAAGGFLPFLLVPAVAAVLGSMALSGWLFTTEALAPDFGRLNPMQGLARMFSVTSLAELGKSILKTVLIGGFAYLVIRRQTEALLGLPTLSVQDGIHHAGSMLEMTFLLISGSLLVLVLFDVPYQLWQHAHNLRMTKEEIKQEAKESEGDPHVKARIRSLQREAARRRMMQEVPKADVIITNPTRFAVALRYQADMRAPQVVASGRLLLAQRIRELAAEHAIPIIEAPPLARALYKHVAPGKEVPATLYHAVAAVMAYVYQLRQYQAGQAQLPQLPADLPVPPGMDPEGGSA
jgi:flagellar biosynthesis protein FlhB